MIEFNKDNGVWAMPSLNRPKNLVKFFKSAVETKMSTNVLIMVDEIDYGKNCIEYQKIELPEGSRFLVTPGAITQGQKQRFLSHLPQYQGYEWVGTINDDHIAKTDHWDLMILEKLNGKNMVSGNDLWVFKNGRCVSPNAWSMGLLDAVGGMFPGDFDHSYIDDMWELIGREIPECWIRREDVIMLHEHHLLGKSEHDATYKHADSLVSSDKKKWYKWMETEYLPTIKKVKELQKSDVC